MSRFDVDAIAFDLDGTLVDSVGDLSLALDATLAEEGLATVPPAIVRDLIGKGIPALIARACARTGANLDAARVEAMLPRYFAHYEAAIGRRSTLFPGVADALRALRARGLKLAVVTNKAARFVRPHLARAGIAEAFDALVGGDEAPAKKPAAAPLELAARRLGVEVRRVLMVGDSANDVGCARAAGAPVVVVPWGYREGAEVQALGADAIVDSFDALAELVAGRRTPPLR
jgi:phosphoglycolate phosphatase